MTTGFPLADDQPGVALDAFAVSSHTSLIATAVTLAARMVTYLTGSA
jgi:hypothetical protein